MTEPLREEFKAAVAESIDDVFSSLGKPVKAALYDLLETKYGVRKQDIPDNLQVFAHAIESTFGSSAKILEIKIMERLHTKNNSFQYRSKDSEFFTEYLTALQAHLNC